MAALFAPCPRQVKNKPMKFHHLLTVLFFAACGENKDQAPVAEKPAEAQSTAPAANRQIERLMPELDAIIDTNAVIEVLAEGYTWSEGPLWVPGGDYLLFTDVPENKIYKWKEGEGVSLYLTPAGFTGKTTTSPEPGGNGLTLDAKGRLVICQHGDRRIARMKAPLDQPKPDFETLADKWNGKRFNSPNDLVFDKAGNLYFTDPPYGLKNHDRSSDKEIPFQGVYRLNTKGKVELLDSTMSRPNGIALTADEKTLFVANSDPEYCYWKAFDILPDGKLTNERLFHDATTEARTGMKGLPDGLKINKKGILFATGPGGVMILNQNGVLVGRINPGQPTANCELSPDEKTLYMTSDMYLYRVLLK